jgi:hypothetical protein
MHVAALEHRGDFNPHHHFHAEGTGRHARGRHARRGVVIGDGQRGDTGRRGRAHELFGTGPAVRGRSVQMKIDHAGRLRDLP